MTAGVSGQGPGVRENKQGLVPSPWPLVPSPCRRGFTLVEILAVLAIIGVLAGLLLSGIVAARNAAGKQHTRVIITQIEAAITRYQNDYGDFPPGEGGAAGSESLYQALSNPNNPNGTGPYISGNEPPVGDPDNSGRNKMLDHWKRPIHYTHHRHYSGDPRADEYRLQSPGLDGQYDTDDDITNWKK